MTEVDILQGALDMLIITAVFMWMNSHIGHREHREMIMSSVPSVCSVANSLHSFENWYKTLNHDPMPGRPKPSPRRLKPLSRKRGRV
jgi:hypothetical protein